MAWRVQIMACKSFDAGRNGTDSDIIEGLNSPAPTRLHHQHEPQRPGLSAALSNAISSVRENGIIVVTSAGNEAANIDISPRYPACYNLDNIITVAATTRTDELWSSSNYGATNVDLAARGIRSLRPSPSATTSTSARCPASFSAPYVSGTCALLLAKYQTKPTSRSSPGC